jgi:cell division protein ZapA
MDQLIAATVVIGDRNYRIKIQPEDEEVVRKSVKTINDKIIEFKTEFAGKDMQDYIAMVLVWFATEKGAGSNDGMVKDNILEKLNSLERMLDGDLEQKNR